MEYVIGLWLLCGIGSGIVAASKGRSGCGWLIAGFLLGPIGLIISAGMSNLAQATQLEALAAERQREQANTRACPQCAEQIQRAAVKCRFCNAAPPSAGGARTLKSGAAFLYKAMLDII